MLSQHARLVLKLGPSQVQRVDPGEVHTDFPVISSSFPQFIFLPNRPHPLPPPTTPNLDSQLPFSLALNVTPLQPQTGVELVPLTFSACDLEPLHPHHGIFLCWALLLGAGSAPNILPNSLVPSHQFPPGTGTEVLSLHHPLPN